MNDKTISKIMEWDVKDHKTPIERYRELSDILSRAEAEPKEEGLREAVEQVNALLETYIRNKYDMNCPVLIENIRRLKSVYSHPTPDKAVEPLHKHPRVSRIGLDILVDEKWVGFTNRTIEACEKDARAYLESLEDKGGK